MSGALSRPFQVLADPHDVVCAGHLADDPQAINYMFQGQAAPDTTHDIGVTLNFAVHRYSKSGTFKVGAYPKGSPTAPAVALVVREISARDIVSWISVSGAVVVDPGARSGLIDLQLNSTSGLGTLAVVGTWVCPTGS